MTRRSGAFAMLGAALCFAAVEWVADQFRQSYSTVQIVWTRYGVQLLLIGAVAVAKKWNPLRTGRLGTQLFRSMRDDWNASILRHRGQHGVQPAACGRSSGSRHARYVGWATMAARGRRPPTVGPRAIALVGVLAILAPTLGCPMGSSRRGTRQCGVFAGYLP